jgi:hypothetical protein
MALTKQAESQRKFVVEYKDDEGKLESRWHYDLDITRAGPYLVENFNLPRKEKRVAKKKK